jgi:hypothetical protein
VQRYFFHTQTDTRFTDEDGTVLTSAAEARSQAIKTCGQMMADSPEGFWGSRPWSVTVTNLAGLVLWEIFMDGVACQPDAA